MPNATPPPAPVTILLLSPGPTPGCQDCPDNGRQDWDDGYFSWGDCPGCPVPEGGIRYAAHVVFTDQTYDHLNVCGDCLLAIADTDPEGRTDRLLAAYDVPHQP